MFPLWLQKYKSNTKEKQFNYTITFCVNFCGLEWHMIKNLLNIIIASFFLVGIFHLEHVNQSHGTGYSLCAEGCHNEDHLSALHHCETCINKNNRLISNNSFIGISKEACFSYFSFESVFNRNGLLTTFSGRPPPNII